PVYRSALDDDERLRAPAVHGVDRPLLSLERARILQPPEVDHREPPRVLLCRRTCHHASTSRRGASSISFSVFRNCAASAPSTTRWSEESVTRIVGRAASAPSRTTARSETAPTASTAACGG